MNKENYNEAKNHVLQRENIKTFINNIASVLNKDCTEGVSYRPFADAYVRELEKFNLSRLESFIIIQELREILEDENGYACNCIDSFIDDIYTRHTGDCAFEGLLQFKNEPIVPLELRHYIDSNIWMNDASWKENW